MSKRINNDEYQPKIILPHILKAGLLILCLVLNWYIFTYQGTDGKLCAVLFDVLVAIAVAAFYSIKSRNPDDGRH
jgi:hypothetical protein